MLTYKSDKSKKMPLNRRYFIKFNDQDVTISPLNLPGRHFIRLVRPYS